MSITKISLCLWFDGQAEAAARFYTSIFPNSKLGAISRYGEAGHDIHGHDAGTVLTVAFELEGLPFTALNGGPLFKFTEAVSFQILCDTQEEVDHYWEKLTEGGPVEAQQCGWLKDQFGVSWQVTPAILSQLLTTGDYAARERTMAAMLQMKKMDIAALQGAHEG